jgi:RNA polymerase sigma-70 factor (ECF subfamily)
MNSALDSAPPEQTAAPEPSPTNFIDEDLALVHASKSGDMAAFEQLVKRYDRKLLRIAQNVTHDLSDAQDVVQESFLKAFRKLDQFRETSRFSTWLIRIALNESFMKVRQIKTTSKFFVEDVPLEIENLPADLSQWVPNPEELCSRSELREILRKSLEELNPRLKSVFVLRDIEELSISETAEILSLTPTAVKARLFRARLQLREILSKYFRVPHNNSEPAQGGVRVFTNQESATPLCG